MFRDTSPGYSSVKLINPHRVYKGTNMDKHPQCHKKHTPRSEQLVKDVTTRLNRAIGQLNGVKQMVEEDRYCGDVLTQLAAAQSAVKAVSRMVLEDHLQSCVIEEVQQGNTKVISEVVDLLKKFS